MMEYHEHELSYILVFVFAFVLRVAVLKLYGISTLEPQVWEAVDHEKEGPLAGTLTGEDGTMAEEMDPLGMKGKLTRYVVHLFKRILAIEVVVEMAFRESRSGWVISWEE